jgi:hypothetical protein
MRTDRIHDHPEAAPDALAELEMDRTGSVTALMPSASLALVIR